MSLARARRRGTRPQPGSPLHRSVARYAAVEGAPNEERSDCDESDPEEETDGARLPAAARVVLE